MQEHDIIGSIFFIILILAIFLPVLWLIIEKRIEKRRQKIVSENSRIIPRLKHINEKYCFIPLQEEYVITKYCNSKREYSQLDFDVLTCRQIAENLSETRQLLSDVIKNKNNSKSYFLEFADCLGNITNEDELLYSKWDFFLEYEDKICEELKLNPVTDLRVKVIKKYISPMGRNHYSSFWLYDTDDIIKFYKQAKEFKRYQKDSSYIREAISPSMRYDIMKRDNFRCVLCGASANEGAKLHIDHILPVSRGGKTEPSNLRTLCDRCNLGKGAKYNPYGPN